MRKICARFSPYAQYMHKICARLYFFLQYKRFVQDCTYFPNVQYMRKICARLYLFLQCTIQGVAKNFLESGEQCIVASPFDFFWVSDKTQKKNAARIAPTLNLVCARIGLVWFTCLHAFSCQVNGLTLFLC